MLQSLSGQVSAKKTDALYLASGAIEWHILMSLTSLSQLKVGQEAKIYCHLHHKEDTMQLFGFTTEAERELFFSLTKVNGVGPKAALKMLSGLSVEAFKAALEAEDIVALTRVPGVGKATAQKIVLALKGKLVSVDEPASGGQHSELIESLTAMGFDKKRVTAVVNQLAKEQNFTSEGEQIRLAIIELSKG